MRDREIAASWKLGLLGTFEEAIHRLEELHDWDQQTIKGLRNENEKLKNNTFKEESVNHLVKEMQQMRHDYENGFPVSDEELARLATWQTQHIQSYHKGNLPEDSWSYIFIPKATEVVKICRCNDCYDMAVNLACSLKAKPKDYIETYDAEFRFDK